jgi:hypothetical protein
MSDRWLEQAQVLATCGCSDCLDVMNIAAALRSAYERGLEDAEAVCESIAAARLVELRSRLARNSGVPAEQRNGALHCKSAIRSLKAGKGEG